jgi:hypothetical protein
MRSLNVLLLEGFLDDEVAVTVDGREAARRGSVSSSPLIGMAGDLFVEVADDARLLTVTVASRGFQASTPLTAGVAKVVADLSRGVLELRPATGREGGM